jgi:phosphoenolpyruvate synthase/pyruvate phosphate dikinase
MTMNELLAHLLGKQAPTEYILIRKTTYQKYSKLPAYPRVICGQFNPLKWAVAPNRRTDIFDSHCFFTGIGDKSTAENIIIGIPGSNGTVEGLVRRLDTPEEGEKKQKGAIPLTSLTNIGWTFISPRTGAIITDIGAPLSHAAIVAREMGTPAVVNCGDATMRLHSGDRVRVGGGRGIVEILETMFKQVSEVP